jgi:beta-N-acetylhexosaminidase
MVTDILRNQLGYQGVIITDSTHMDGVYDYFGLHQGKITYDKALGEAAVEGILAGDDIIEGAFDPYTSKYVLNYVRDAVNQGRITTARIDESVRRILQLKWSYGVGIDRFLAFAGMATTQSPSSAITVPTSDSMPRDLRSWDL